MKCNRPKVFQPLKSAHLCQSSLHWNDKTYKYRIYTENMHILNNSKIWKYKMIKLHIQTAMRNWEGVGGVFLVCFFRLGLRFALHKENIKW